MTIAATPDLRIPVPPDFPVEFEDGDVDGFWTFDPMHFPRPMAPMTFGLMAQHFATGFDDAMEAYSVPIRAQMRRFNSYSYQSFAPLPLAPEELEAEGRRSEGALQPLLGRLLESWREELLPQVLAHHAFWDGFDLAGASDADLVAHARATGPRVRDLWRIHFIAALGFLLGPSLFEELYRELFPDADEFEPWQLLQGFDAPTLAGGRELWRLSRLALAAPEVKAVLESEPAGDVIPALERSGAGRAFLVELRAFLEEYGKRGESHGELRDPSWIEDPTPVVQNLKDYITQPDRDLAAEMDEQGAARERAVAAARARLAGYPEAIVGRFEAMLKAGQDGMVLSEEHNHYIDFGGMHRVRLVALELGRRLAARGAIDAVDDVFMLRFEGAIEALEGAAGAPDLRPIVAERRAEMERFADVTPPPVLGTMPAGPRPDSPMGRALDKFFGGRVVEDDAPDVLRGNSGSSGVARGRVRVLHALAEAVKLEGGDVLVATTTAPPWTPLFATVAAVVTDTGGILSHSAVVAREYGIPAVVGAARATAVLRDGQLVEVDGDAGTVRIIEG